MPAPEAPSTLEHNSLPIRGNQCHDFHNNDDLAFLGFTTSACIPDNAGVLLPVYEPSMKGIMLYMLFYIFFHSHFLLCGANIHSFPVPFNILLSVHSNSCIYSTFEHLEFFQFRLLGTTHVRTFF